MNSPELERRSRRAMAEMAMRKDPLDEAACRMVMQLAVEDGEFDVALKAYETLCEAVGTPTSEESNDLMQALKMAIKTGKG